MEDTVVTDVGVPAYITTIDELMSIRDVVLQTEAADRAALNTMFNPDPGVLKSKLVEWASKGFLPYSVLSTIQLTPPTTCSDGNARGFYAYALYLLDSPLEPLLETMSTQVLGVTFKFFLRDTNTIGINILKD
jgi:hypothetical protein